MRTVVLPRLAWHGVKALELEVPSSWRLEVLPMAGAERPALTAEAIRETIAAPLGMPPLRECAKGRREVVIIFDDMTRVTRAAEIVPHVLAELGEAGIRDEQVRFIAACGCHGAMTRTDFAKKLGEEVLRRFPVYNHSPFDNCVYAGTTRRGTRVFISAEVMRCDLKIGIGSVVPHGMVGFGGGGKIILPGVASYETILAFHSTGSTQVELGAMGMIAVNPARQDIDEAVSMAGLDMKIDALVNMWGETVALFAGAPSAAFDAALDEAKRHYLTARARDKDIVIANTFAKASEAASGLPVAFPAVKQEGGDVVLIASAPEGQATHYLMGPFGKHIAGRLPLRVKVPPNVRRLFVYSDFPDLAARGYFADAEKVVFADDLSKVITRLAEDHGDAARVAVYPSADIQYCPGG
ncbi:MAG: lactate racemase domain-containing protein [Dehalococcoidales bacterium]|nr:lactate racemase domain-containing protein [Dehalococcoidales bacterium]